ncbi:MAG TPA: SAM-dependent methyltransferase [Streptosporangiaceae bacterium]|nr:SAM-dependent methyltransferase [Streptosporangiaceae bacterium]
MTQAPVPPGVDQSRPSAARIYDCLLGGKNNFPVDRVAVEMMRARAPELIDSAFANRGFHQRAAKWIAEQGVSQFIDLGSGLPTVGNTHEVVRKIWPDARVVYVDNDPMVLQHGSFLLTGDKAASVVLADVRDPDAVLGNEDVRRLIDFSEPVGVLMTAVMHFVADSDDPGGLISRYLAPLAAGSYLSMSHMTGDHKPPKAVAAIVEAGRQSAGGACLRSKDEIRKLFDGLELVTPYSGAAADVTWVGLWNCEDPELADSEGSRWLYCGVARKTC